MTDRDLQVQQIIEQNPGIQFREIMRSSGLKNGVLSHYLGKLEKNGTIKVTRGPRQSRFYPPRDLLLALIQEDGLEFTQLVKAVKKSPSTVSLYLSQIVEDGLVEIRLVSLKKRYYIKARNLIDKLIEDYRPSLLEKPTSGFEDIINSF